jgi:PAS domain S-box-containing protein
VTAGLLAEKGPLVGFATALALLALVGLTQYQAIRRMAAADESVAHCEAVLGELQGLAAGIGAAESFSRGYVATGNEVFLADFEPAVQSAQSHVSALRKLLAAEPDQLSRLDSLAGLLANKVLLCHQAVDFRRNEGLSGATFALNTGLGLTAMRELMESEESISRPEETTLKVSRARSRSTAESAVQVTVFGSLLALTLLVVAALIVGKDLRLRRQAEHRLAAERDFAEAVLDNISEGILACNTEGVVTRANRAARKLLDQHDPTPAPLLDFAGTYSVFLPDGETPVPLDARPLTRAARGESITDCELILTTEHGDTRTVLASAQPMRDASARPLGAVLALHDITESRRAALLLREKDELYRSVIATMAEGIVVQDREGRVTAFNDAALRILSVTADELLGATSYDKEHLTVRADGSPFPGTDHPAMVTLRTGKPQSNVMMGILKPGGTCLWILVNSQPLTLESVDGTRLNVVATFTDISDLRRAQDAIARSERNLRDAQQLAGIGSWTRSAATGKVLWSEQLYRIFRRDPQFPPVWEELRTALFSPERSRVEAADQRLLTSGTPFEMDLELIDGLGWVSTRAEAEFDMAGRITGWRGTVQDITERKRAERQLETYASELDDLYNRAPCGYHSVDSSGLILRINDTELAMLGYTADEVVGTMHVTDLIPEEQRGLFYRNFERYKRVGETADLEYDFLRKDGSRLPISLSATMLRDENGDFLRSRATVIDMTERKRARDAQRLAEEALRASEQRYRRFVERNPAGVIRTTDTGEILECNSSFARMLGYDSPAELIGLRTAQFRCEPTARGLFADSLRDSKVMVNYETRLRTRNGLSIWTSATAFLNEDEPSRPVHEGIVIDIARRKYAEDALALRNRIADIFLTAPHTEVFPGVVATVREATESEQATLAYSSDAMEFLTIESGAVPTTGAYTLNVPVVFQEERIGSLGIARAAQPPGETDRNFLSGIANYLAPIMRAHLLRHREECERRRAEDALRLSLAEKEVLVREIHHRVKNNLQIIASLLRMQGNLTDNIEARELFRESENRVASMSAIHESLYGTSDLGRIDVTKYIRRVVDHIAACYRRPGVSCIVQSDGMSTLPIGAAMPCGLIVNELVSNALKHAFAEGPGRVTVNILRADKLLTVTVQDDGQGLPPGFGLAEQSGLGLTLVQALTRQLRGRMSVACGAGASFRLEFESPS